MIIDRDSSTLTSLASIVPGAVVRGLFGTPRTIRKGVYVDTRLPDGNYAEPRMSTWIENGQTYNGIVCPAIRFPNVVYTDQLARQIPYRGNLMLVPYLIQQ